MRFGSWQARKMYKAAQTEGELATSRQSSGVDPDGKPLSVWADQGLTGGSLYVRLDIPLSVSGWNLNVDGTAPEGQEPISSLPLGVGDDV